MITCIQECKAFLFPGEEDFGIAPIEAQAAGRPPIAYRSGGDLDTIIEKETGLFFSKQIAEFLIDTIHQFKAMQFYSNSCRNNALRFSTDSFHTKIREYAHKSVIEFKAQRVN